MCFFWAAGNGGFAAGNGDFIERNGCTFGGMGIRTCEKVFLEDANGPYQRKMLLTFVELGNGHCKEGNGRFRDGNGFVVG